MNTSEWAWLRRSDQSRTWNSEAGSEPSLPGWHWEMIIMCSTIDIAESRSVSRLVCKKDSCLVLNGLPRLGVERYLFKHPGIVEIIDGDLPRPKLTVFHDLTR